MMSLQRFTHCVTVHTSDLTGQIMIKGPDTILSDAHIPDQRLQPKSHTIAQHCAKTYCWDVTQELTA